jgi:amino acid transporter
VFLDAALGLSVWGAIFIFVILFLLLGSGTVLAYGLRLRKKDRKLLSWLLVLPSVILLAGIAAFFIHAFSDFRTHRQIVLDLRKPQSAILMDLRSACPYEPNSPSCDLTRYIFDVIVIFPDSLQLSVTANTVEWSVNENKTLSYIVLMSSKSLSLPAGRDLLLQHAASFSKDSDTETKQKIEAIGEWIVECCKDNAVYSEVNSIRLRPYLNLEFRKNIDHVRVDYFITAIP